MDDATELPRSNSGQEPEPAGGAGTAAGRWRAMPFIAVGVAMIVVEATIVNVAVPTIIRELHLGATGAEWLNSIYALVFAALLISFGHAGDRWGRRRLFLLGAVIFVAASLIAATAPNGAVLIAGRFIQGIGGAMILPATLSTVNAMFTGHERAIAFAIWGSTIGGFAALGPLAGGWLTTDFSWRWAFLVNLPIGAIVVIGILFFIPETSDPTTRRGLDVPGNALAVIGFAGIVFALIEGVNYGWWNAIRAFTLASLKWPAAWISPVPVALAIGVVALGAFVAVETRRRRRGSVVLVDLSLFAIRSFSAGNVAALVVSLGEFGLLFVLPLFLQGVLGYSALGTGVLFLALAAGTLVAGGATPQIAKLTSARGVARTGLALEVIGIAGVAVVVSPSVGAWILAIPLFVYGVGVGFATAQLTGVILTDVPVEQSGRASGIQSTARQVGSALGIAVLGAIYLTRIGSVTERSVAGLPGVGKAVASQVAALVRTTGGAAIQSLHGMPGGSALVAAASGAAVDATRAVALTAALFILVGLAATLLLKPAATPADGGGTGSRS